MDVFDQISKLPDLDFGVVGLNAEGRVVAPVWASCQRLLDTHLIEGELWLPPKGMNPTKGGIIPINGRLVDIRPLSTTSEISIWMASDITIRAEAEKRAAEATWLLELYPRRHRVFQFIERERETLDALSEQPPEIITARIARIEAEAEIYGMAGTVAACHEAFETEYSNRTLTILQESLNHFAGLHRLLICPPDANMRPPLELDVFAPIAHRIAERLDKKIEFQVSGTPAEDLRPIYGSIVPLIENAIVHGIEPPEMRGSKNERGKISLSFSEQATFWTLTVSDDGRGINVDEIAERALRHGRIDEPTVNKLVPHERLALAFVTPSQSHASTGGLSTLRARANQFGGHVEIRTALSQNTTIRVHMPKSIGHTSPLN